MSELQTRVDRYEMGARIGEGGQGITRSAVDRKTGRPVVVKELRVEHLDDWKAVELFEREGEALQALDHPAIPAYVDHFHVDTADSSRLFLVQEYVDGVDLARAIDDGLRLTEGEAIELVAELLEILDHIHSLTPPIIHRDIKPANIIRREDGSLALVDFGAARTVLEETTGGSTVVGTSGYMPLEQMMGRAAAATDLYAVGATAIHLLSHKHPADIDVLEMKLQFHDDISVSQGLADFLDKLVEPHLEDRYETAEQALRALRRIGRAPVSAPDSAPAVGASAGAQAPKKAGTSAPLEQAPRRGGAEIDGVIGGALSKMVESSLRAGEKAARAKLGWAQGFFDGDSYECPPGSFWSDIERDGARVLHREPMGLSGAKNSILGVVILYGLVGFFVAVMLFGDQWGFESSGSPTFGWVMMGVFAFAGIFVIYKAAVEAFGVEEFELTPDAIIHRTRVFDHERTKVIDLDLVDEVDMTWSTSTGSSTGGNRRTTNQYYFVIVAAYDEHKFGESMSKDEKLWAASAIRDHLAAQETA